MTIETKTCSITEDEIKSLIHYHASNSMYSNMDYAIERINYLNKRLKAEKKEKNEIEQTSTEQPTTEQKASW